MNNKKKFLSLLVFAPLLVGCGNNVKAPKFLAKGKEVSADNFKAALKKNKEKSSIAKDKKFGQCLYNYKLAESEVTEQIRNKKTVTKRGQHTKTDNKMEFDPDQLVVLTYTTGASVIDYTDKSGKSSQETTANNKTGVQFSKVKKNNYLINVDYNAKTYRELVATDKKTAQASLDYEAKSLASDLYSQIESLVSNYDDADEEGKKNYKFYQNENIFTIEFLSEKSDESSYNESLLLKRVTKVTNTIQIDATDGKWAAKKYWTRTTDTEYFQNYYSYAKGDNIHSEEKESRDYKFEFKNVKVSPADLSQFKAIGFDA